MSVLICNPCYKQSAIPVFREKQSPFKQSNDILKSFWKEVCSHLFCRNKSRRRSTSVKASLAAETAVAFPVFFFALYFLLQLFSMLQAELMIAEAGIAAAREAAGFGYVQKRMDLKEEEQSAAKELLKSYGSRFLEEKAYAGLLKEGIEEERLLRGGVREGKEGLTITSREEGEIRRVEITFSLSPVIPLFALSEKAITIPVVYRLWSGEGEVLFQNEGSERLVYVTKNGRVYHVSLECSYLNLSLKEVLYGSLEEVRNQSGERYTPCEWCAGGGHFREQQPVYITEYGNRFHTTLTCGSISRTIRTMPEEEAKESYPACKKCGGGE